MGKVILRKAEVAAVKRINKNLELTTNMRRIVTEAQDYWVEKELSRLFETKCELIQYHSSGEQPSDAPEIDGVILKLPDRNRLISLDYCYKRGFWTVEHLNPEYLEEELLINETQACI